MSVKGALARAGAGLLLAAVCTAVSAQHVMVFTAKGLPGLSRLDLADDVHVLADSGALLDAMSFRFNGDMDAAQAQATAYMSSTEGKAQFARLAEHTNAIAVAYLMGIKLLPAVLVAPGYVVYGVYDVQEAMDRVADYDKN